jgi:hypothetical protein
MGKYICGPSLLRLPGRPAAIVPTEPFEFAYDPAHEAMALASGAITLQPGEQSMADQIAAREAAERAAQPSATVAAAGEAAPPTAVQESEPVPPAPGAQASDDQVERPAPPASSQPGEKE